MPNGGMNIGAGFMEGFRSFLVPQLLQKNQLAQQQALQQDALMKKELMDTFTKLERFDLIDYRDPLTQEANQFMYSRGGTKAPEGLAQFLVNSRYKLAQLEKRVPEAGKALDAQEAAPKTPATPTFGAAPQAPGGLDLEASKKSLAAVGGDTSLLDTPEAPAPAPEVATPVTPEAPAVTAPEFGQTDVDRAAMQIEKSRRAGITTTIPMGKGGSISFPGISFTDQEKMATKKAYQQFNAGKISLDEATSDLGPKENQALRQMVAGDIFANLIASGMPRAQAAKQAIIQSKAMPSQLAKFAFGTEEAAEEARSRGEVEISLIPRKVQTERQAKIDNPLSGPERAVAVAEGKLDPKKNKVIQKQLQGEKPPKVGGPTAAERAPIAAREALIGQVTEIQKLIPKGKRVLGPIAGRIADFSNENLSAMGLSNEEIQTITAINGFQNVLFNLRSGGAIPEAEMQRLEREAPNVKVNARVNAVRVAQTIKNLQRIQKVYGDVLSQSGMTNLPAAVTGPDPDAPAPAAAPPMPKILSIKPHVAP